MNIQSTFDYFLKIVIVGDSGVGKTNFLSRFIYDRFNILNQPTLGTDFQSKIIFLPKTKQNVKLQFWDTAGQERYRAINKIYFQKVQGIILVYDLTDLKTYTGLDNWVQLINDSSDDVPIVLIGNKLDDASENRIVRYEEGKSYADKHGFLFFETSALNGKNISKAVYSLCEKIISHINKTMSFNLNLSVSLNSNILENKKTKKKERKVSCC